jgi:NTP pyrophosphatase (non-canonical NTP hydrolase)|tara:strand:+ start:2496 stop:2963 length:468 start_codon:yes stop_codon:yes gene_type:complete
MTNWEEVLTYREAVTDMEVEASKMASETLDPPVQLEFDFMEVDYEQLTRDTKMLNEYQQDIEQFIMCEGDARLLENTLGITGEAGEVSEKIKKHVRDGTPLDKDGVIKELGDVLFYVAALATHLDEDLSEVAAINIEKLRDRKARGVIQGQGDNR